jgi:hypothetical protein
MLAAPPVILQDSRNGLPILDDVSLLKDVIAYVVENVCHIARLQLPKMTLDIRKAKSSETQCVHKEVPSCALDIE